MRSSGVRLILTTAFILGLSALPAMSQAADAGFQPRVALRLYAGIGWQSLGDVNTGLKGFSDSVIFESMASGYTAGGSYGVVHSGPDVGGDLIIQFSPNFGVGLGTGYIHISRQTELLLKAGNPALHDENFIFTPKINIVPIRVSLFVFVPLDRTVRLSLNAGGELYLASFSSLIRDEFPTWGVWYETLDKVSGQGFGFQAGLGLEIRLAYSLSLILEGQGRLAKIGDLTGTHSFTNSFGFDETHNGTLYYWTDLWTFHPFPHIAVSETVPSEPWEQNPRKASLDLSGWSAVAGFLFRF